jgi:hypothetical protein
MFAMHQSLHFGRQLSVSVQVVNRVGTQDTKNPAINFPYTVQYIGSTPRQIPVLNWNAARNKFNLNGGRFYKAKCNL